MHHLVFTPDRDADTEHDFSGAFEPESIRYKAFHVARGDTVEIHRIDISKLRDLLKHPTNGFRYEIPYLTIPQIQARLLAPA